MSVFHQSLKILWLLIISAYTQTNENFNNTNELNVFEKSEVLSRKKRFIVFPEGSSFQLVFCVTYPAIFEIGDIFLWGNTAALAWELPQDPYSPFMHRADPLHRRVDSKTIYYTDEIGKVLFKRPYKKRKIIVNPAFAKRSVDRPLDAHQFSREVKEFKIDRKQMHASKNKREFLKSEHMETQSVEFHRSSRAALYHKIETLVQGFGGNGKHCVLKSLCLVGKAHHLPQGSFFQEILRSVFTLPKSLSEDKYKEYDEATSSSKSCDELYPDCAEPLMDSTSPILNY